MTSYNQTSHPHRFTIYTYILYVIDILQARKVTGLIGTCKHSLWFAVYKLSTVPLIHPRSVVQRRLESYKYYQQVWICI